MRLIVASVCTISLLFLVMACSPQGEQQDKDMQSSSALDIVQWPIIYNDKREQLSLEYLDTRYGIEAQKAQITPKMVVVHWTSIPTLEDSFNAFNSPMLPSSRDKISSASQLNVSTHYLVDRDGTVYQLLPNTTFARHVIGLNHSAIGIENVGNGSSLPLTAEQLTANIALIKQLSQEFPIDYVIGHYEYKNFVNHPLWKEVNPNYLTDKTDPGETFIKQIRASLTELRLKDVPDLPK
ncbi:N-acetylmuramoyl-L-alanine amidase [Paraglaciecola aquimarina]|uniref:N-acetylmuramoyl-L-alanine amidase n=1 Tax=Paraglaciecola algarum TaxID=3050085 RepID=A0ABS9D4F3_9ALTE|nr:peptidoglycan recognition family protein [Paraglaciecola sp. G1-23]MCF2947818.1 N-acetylmuramoyl-L-alanine amidase [Paraglaciecola sp. G1-23]